MDDIIKDIKKLHKTMTYEDIARLLGIGTRTLTRWIKRESKMSSMAVAYIRPKLSDVLKLKGFKKGV